MNKAKKPTIRDLNYAKNLAKQLGAEHRYRWEQDYWAEEELLTLIHGLEKRARCRQVVISGRRLD